MGELQHLPAMVEEVVQFLDCRPDRTYVDCTLGGGGHAIEILKKSIPSGRLIGIDCDLSAIDKAKKRLETFQERVTIIHDNYINLGCILEGLKIEKVDGILFDLGISSFQVDSGERGFSFQLDSPLDMRFDQRTTLSAYHVVNKFPASEIKKIIKNYGEERFADRITRAIDKKRKVEPISTTDNLSQIIKYSVPKSYRWGRIHPATRTFQAIRIAVNDELNNFKKALYDSINFLVKGGRLCVVSFHSLEDKITKHFFKDLEKNNGPLAPAKFKILTKKPLIPKISETDMNPRSRSSKLRVVERL